MELPGHDAGGPGVCAGRRLPGAREYLRFTVQTPPGDPAHAGLGRVGAPRLDAWPALFREAAKTHGLDEAWLRAIAHAESGFEAAAVSPKGARGVMQLMPEVIADYAVSDPDSPAQSIRAGARHLRWLLRRYNGDRTRALAAYNAGAGTVDRYDGVPPYVMDFLLDTTRAAFKLVASGTMDRNPALKDRRTSCRVSE